MNNVEYIYVRTPVFKKANKNTYLFQVVDNSEYKNDVHGKGCTEKVYTPDAFKEFCANAKLWSVNLHLSKQIELDFLTSAIEHCNIESFELHFPDKSGINLSPLEKLKNVEQIFLFELSRIEELWDTTKNPKLKLLHILNCNRLHNFTQLENSHIETLKLFGCNGLSSFTSKLHIDDFSFVMRMPKLKSLHIEIIKDKPSDYYLNILAQMKNLQEFMCPESFFTFEQFAWLASKLPDAKGLEPSLYCKELDTYSIIGNRKPRFLKDKQRIEKYEIQYRQLIKDFKLQNTPPLG